MDERRDHALVVGMHEDGMPVLLRGRPGLPEDVVRSANLAPVDVGPVPARACHEFGGATGALRVFQQFDHELLLATIGEGLVVDPEVEADRSQFALAEVGYKDFAQGSSVCARLPSERRFLVRLVRRRHCRLCNDMAGRSGAGKSS
jgi:hypothetical protein